jgi:hypothetical protein
MTVGSDPWSLALSMDSSINACLLMDASIPARLLSRILDISAGDWFRSLLANALFESIDLPQHFPGSISEVQILQSSWQHP